MSDTPVCTIDETGIHRPSLQTCLAYFQTKFKAIYGEDIYIDPDSQDGQFLGLLASALDDMNGTSVATYNAFSPSTAKGTGLSSVVKINGIARKIPTYSMVEVTIGGVVGTQIKNGVVRDANKNLWDLPPLVTIPPEGVITVTAVCETVGAVLAFAHTVTEIFTATPGWQTVTNDAASSTGAPVELDGQLRQRQSVSAALPASGGSYASLKAAVAAIPGVARYQIFENNDPAVDVNGIPGNSIAVVVNSGNAQVLIDTIAQKKGNGVQTYGNYTGLTTPDVAGITRQISFSYEMNIPIAFYLKIQPLKGFTAAIQESIQKSLSDWVNSLPPGSFIDLSDAYMYARLNGAANEKTYRIYADTLQIGLNGAAPAIQNINMAFNEKPYCEPNFVTIVLKV